MRDGLLAGVGRGGKTRTHAEREKGETEFLAAGGGKMVKGKRFREKWSEAVVEVEMEMEGV